VSFLSSFECRILWSFTALNQIAKILKILLSSGLFVLTAYTSYAQGEVEIPDTSRLLVEVTQPDTIQTKDDPKDYLDAIVDYNASDSINMSFKDSKIRLYGDASVVYKDFDLKAAYIEISIDKKEVYARGVADSSGVLTGKPKFTQDEEEYDATELKYNFESQKAWVTDVITKQEENALLHSSISKRFPDGTLNIKDGKFTTCDADHPHFYFAITKGKMVPEKSTVAGPAYLVVEDIPLYFIGLPFGYFPQKRQKTSGLVMPQYGYEPNRGYYLRNGGWFFSLNDNFDLKLTGDIYSKGSWKGGALTNYAKRYKFRGNFDFSYAKNATGERSLRDIDPTAYKVTNDFRVRWSHNQDAKAHPYRTFNASVNLSSSSFDKYNSNINNTAAILTNQKSSSISYARKFPNRLFNFTAKVGHTQNSRDSSVVLNLPTASFTVGRFYPFKRKNPVGKQKWYEKIDMRYSSSLENKVYAHENQLFTKDIADSLPSVLNNMRSGFKHSIPMTASFKLIPHMTLTPSLKYQGLLYFYSTTKEWDPDEEEIIESRMNQLQYVQALSPNISLTYNPQIYGFYDFKRGKVKVIRHVAKPSLSFSYRPDLGYDDSMYYDTVQTNASGRTSRYSTFEDGLYNLPSVAGQYGTVSFSLGNNLEMKVVDPTDTTGQLKKVKLIESLNINTSYNIFSDSMKLAPLRLSARTKILNNFNINFSSTFDPYAWIEEQDGSTFSQHKIDKYLITESGLPARLTNASMSVDFSLPFRKTSGSGGGATEKFYEDMGVSYGLPWDVRFGYSLRYDNFNPYTESKLTQTLRFSGNVQFSPKWSLRYSSGYDFVGNEFTYTSLTVNRDLHCWQMSFTIIPFGSRKSYSFMINVKANLFKDVKYRKEKSWYDNADFFN
jgi:hypothetical protein